MDTDKAKTGAKTRKSRNNDSKQLTGRPSDFTQELGDTICDRMANGESLRSICRSDGFPHVGTVLRWVARDQIFREQYENAMAQRADALFEEMFDIADDTSNDTIHTENGDHANKEWISRSRLKVDVRKWALSKMLPKKYGDKLQIGGAADLPPVQSNVTIDPGEAYKRLLNPGTNNE